MSAPENAISLTIVDRSDFGSEVLKSLYRLTGRSTGELRRAIHEGAPVYTAALFGNDHINVVPRLERTAAYLDSLGVPFTVDEWVDGERDQISVETMRAIIESADGSSS